MNLPEIRSLDLIHLGQHYQLDWQQLCRVSGLSCHLPTENLSAGDIREWTNMPSMFSSLLPCCPYLSTHNCSAWPQRKAYSFPRGHEATSLPSFKSHLLDLSIDPNWFVACSSPTALHSPVNLLLNHIACVCVESDSKRTNLQEANLIYKQRVTKLHTHNLLSVSLSLLSHMFYESGHLRTLLCCLLATLWTIMLFLFLLPSFCTENQPCHSLALSPSPSHFFSTCKHFAGTLCRFWFLR